MASPCKPLPQAIPLRPTTIGIFSPTVFHWSLTESRSYSLISPSTTFHPLVAPRMSWRDSAIAFNKDEFIRIESTLIIKYDSPWTEDFLRAQQLQSLLSWQTRLPNAQRREVLIWTKVPFIEQTLPTDDVPFGGWELQPFNSAIGRL